MKQIFHNKKYSVVALVLACLIFIVPIVYAAYTNISYKKGVTIAKIRDTAFSSNYLIIHEKNIDDTNIDDYIVMLSSDEDNDSCLFYLDIYNFAANNFNLPNEFDIVYNLEFVIKPLGSHTLSDGYEINETSLSDISGKEQYTYNLTNQKILGGTIHTAEYKMQIPIDDVENIEVTVKAVPSDPSSIKATDNKILARKLKFSKSASQITDSFNWVGKFQDRQGSTVSTDYSAINYEITGKGEGTIDLEWDSTKFEIDPFFTVSDGNTITDDGTNKKLHLNVNSDTQSYYLIQFYRKDVVDSETWEVLDSLFTFTKTKKPTT